MKVLSTFILLLVSMQVLADCPFNGNIYPETVNVGGKICYKGTFQDPNCVNGIVIESSLEEVACIFNFLVSDASVKKLKTNGEFLKLCLENISELETQNIFTNCNIK